MYMYTFYFKFRIHNNFSYIFHTFFWCIGIVILFVYLVVKFSSIKKNMVVLVICNLILIGNIG